MRSVLRVDLGTSVRTIPRVANVTLSRVLPARRHIRGRASVRWTFELGVAPTSRPSEQRSA